jgi:hypothetical protein
MALDVPNQVKKTSPRKTQAYQPMGAVGFKRRRDEIFQAHRRRMLAQGDDLLDETTRGRKISGSRASTFTSQPRRAAGSARSAKSMMAESLNNEMMRSTNKTAPMPPVINTQ